VAYNRAIVDVIRSNESNSNINVVQIEKAVLRTFHNRHYDATDAHRRSASGDMLDGFVAAMTQEGSQALLNSLTGGVYGCAHDLVDDAIDVYNAFENGQSFSVADILSSVAHTVADCLSGFANTIPIVGQLIDFIKAACSAEDIAQKCAPFVEWLDGTSFSEYDVGFNLGSCVVTVASSMSRRSVENVPAEWVCKLEWYNSSDGCDVGCGAFDPDCYSTAPNQRTFYPYGRLAAPAAWSCPLPYYGSNDGCDTGCGAPDPDCAAPSAQPHLWNATQDFTIQAMRSLALNLQASGAPNSGSNGGAPAEYKPITITIAAVLGTCFIVLGALVYAFRRRKARALQAEMALNAALLDTVPDSME